MKKSSFGCVILSAVLALGCLAGCGGNNDPGKTSDASYTVTFDVGEEARAGGVKTPAPQTVESGSTVIEPTIEYEATSTWFEDHELTAWLNGGAEWNFSTATVTSNITLTANWRESDDGKIAAEYEANLTWGEEDHLYVHYLRGADNAEEHGTRNSASKPDYSTPIPSAVYGDWGLWVWEYHPTNSEGRAFYPAFLDESGAVYDIDLKADYHDAGWDSADRDNKGLDASYKAADWLGVQLFSQDSRINGEGFWVNDGGDVYIELAKARRDKGDYHWFVRQGEAQNGSPTYEVSVVFDPYADIEPGSAVTQYDVVSNQGGNDVYVQQEVAKGWEEDYVGYQIFVASFADSDGDGMGDLQGIIEKLDYLEGLGVDVLWLTPFQQSNSYHGYDIQNYFTVDPRFGTLADYRELVTEVHSRGMKILMDFVLNHTSTSNPWFEKSQNLVKETVRQPDGTYKTIDYRNFYTWQNEDYVGNITNKAEKNQWYKDANGYYFFSSFGSTMPELNFDYQATRDAILDVALYWMSFGLDGFRLDAVKHIYMENENPAHSDQIIKDYSDGSVVGSTAGDYSYDVKKDAHFFTEFNAKLKASYPSALLVGENFNGDPIHIAQLYEGLDSQFNFNFYYDMTGAIGTIGLGGTNPGGKPVNSSYAGKALRGYLAAQLDFRQYRTDYIDSIFTSNHDVARARNRVLSKWSDSAADWVAQSLTPSNIELSEKLVKIWNCVCLSMPGITWIYQGDELGMFGDKTANADGSAGHEDRWLRQPMKWTKDRAGDSHNCYYPIGFNNYYMEWDSNNQTLNGVAEQKNDNNSIYNVCANMIKNVRKTSSAFHSGTVINLTAADERDADNRFMIYDVTNGTETFRFYVNAANAAQFVSQQPPAGSQMLFATNGMGLVNGNIPAFTFAAYKIK